MSNQPYDTEREDNLPEGGGPAEGKNTLPPPLRRPLMEWYREKKDKRDLLCIAVLNRGWDFQQNPGSMTETELTEAEYLSAIEEARAIHRECLTKVKRPTACVVLAHPKLLIAVIIRRPTPTEAETLLRIMKDESISEEETIARCRDDLVRRTLWPREGSEPMAYMMEDCPLAFTQVFPSMVQEASGHEAFAKRRG